MRHSNTATFSTAKIKAVCEERKVDFSSFAEICAKLEGLTGTYNRWLALVHDEEVYDFELPDGTVECVPAQLVVENGD